MYLYQSMPLFLYNVCYIVRFAVHVTSLSQTTCCPCPSSCLTTCPCLLTSTISCPISLQADVFFAVPFSYCDLFPFYLFGFHFHYISACYPLISSVPLYVIVSLTFSVSVYLSSSREIVFRFFSTCSLSVVISDLRSTFSCLIFTTC